jgi:peptide chain release factor 1
MDSPVFVFSGSKVKSIFENEVGNHVWQRVPPTEKRGRLHTSSITVAILEKNNYTDIAIHESEVTLTATKGSGPGGQHKNKVETCVTLRHNSTGIQVRVDGRSRKKNEQDAWKELTKRVNHFYRTGHLEGQAEERQSQIGIGADGDKRRTYKVKDGMVTDHITGKSAKLKDILRGKIEKLK